MTLSCESLIARSMPRRNQQRISILFSMATLMSYFLFVKKFVDFFNPRLEQSEGRKKERNRIRHFVYCFPLCALISVSSTSIPKDYSLSDTGGCQLSRGDHILQDASTILRESEDNLP